MKKLSLLLLTLSLIITFTANAKPSFRRPRFTINEKTKSNPPVQNQVTTTKSEPAKKVNENSKSELANSDTENLEKPVRQTILPKEEKVKESPVVPDASGAENVGKLFLESPDLCYVVEYHLNPGAGIACTQPLPIKYTERDCKSSEKKEIGKVNAQISCEKKNLVDMRFRTSKDIVSAPLKVRRSNKGRAGVKSIYSVDSFKIEKPDFFEFIQKPELLPLDGTRPEEAPAVAKYSGFVALEYEKSEGFGYSSSDQDQSNFNLFSNINFELSKDSNRLVTTLEAGETFSGDDESGGRIGAGGHGKLEIRNLYLSHDFYDGLSLRGGRITANSEPRGFIFSDHIFTVQLTYKSDLSEGVVWYGDAKSNRPQNASGNAEASFSDEYFGSYGTLGFLSRFRCTGFSLYRKYRAKNSLTDESTADFTGNTDLYWVGGTIDYDGLNPISFNGTYIFNWGHVGANSDAVNSYLMDGRINSVLFESDWTLTLEGILTSANSEAPENHFYSTVGLPYLLTIFTSDGADDAPGSPKPAVYGSMNDGKGLQIGVMVLTYNINKKATLLLRSGYLQKAFQPTDSGQKIGQENDVEYTYQLSPSSLLQIDYAYAIPGTGLQTDKSVFQLAISKIKFTF